MRVAATVLASVVVAAGAAPAQAGVTFGSNLSLAPDSRCTTNACTVTQISGGSGTFQALADGVLVSFRIRHGPVGPTTANVGFKVLSGSGPDFTFVSQTRLFPFPAANRPAGGITEVAEVDGNGRARGLPIAAGQRIAAVVQDASGDPNQGVPFTVEQPGATLGVLAFDHVAGTASYNAVSPFEVLINATLEPDADRDGYGDETQDNCTTIANDQTSNPCLNPPPPPPPPGPPVLGESFVVAPVAGQTSVQRKGSSEFQLLTQPRRLPIGSLVDTRAGTARVTSARNRRGRKQSGDFFAGLFQVLQSRKRSLKGLTELRLKGSSFDNCEVEPGTAGRARASQRRRLSDRVVRALGGKANGRYRTRGRHSSATVRGTTWGTIDRCDGTLTWITRGSVVVREFRRRRSVVVRSGKPGPLGTTRLTPAPN